MKTLIISDSYDATTDVIIKYVGSENIIRLNFDQFDKTSIHINNSSITFGINNQILTDKEISKLYWRKPFNNDIEADKYVDSELKYIFREIFNIFSNQNKTILVLPNVERYIGKILQMTIAEKYFAVPKWEVLLNLESNFGECIVKSLSSEIVSHKKVLYTTKVNSENLDCKYPWQIQELIDADFDLTVVHVSGKNYAFELERYDNNVDWRKEINKKEQKWKQHKLDPIIDTNIKKYMIELGLKFGRLDFLIAKNEYFFLEVNPNGQWAWLDLDNKNGLMAEMVDQISPLTKTFSIVKTLPNQFD